MTRKQKRIKEEKVSKKAWTLLGVLVLLAGILVGCGSTPEHIKHLKETLVSYTPPPLEEVLAQNRAAQASGGSAKKRTRRNARG